MPEGWSELTTVVKKNRLKVTTSFTRNSETLFHNTTLYLDSHMSYANERKQNRIPVEIASGQKVTFSPGEHSQLIKAIIEEFASRFAPESVLVYANDTGDNCSYFDSSLLSKLDVDIGSHGKMPDVVLHYTAKNWLLLVEAVTSQGPINEMRHEELAKLFKGSSAGLVYVTAFPDRSLMSRYLGDIAWKTEVWVADSPSHLIHFNGTRFLGPYSEPEN